MTFGSCRKPAQLTCPDFGLTYDRSLAAAHRPRAASTLHSRSATPARPATVNTTTTSNEFLSEMSLLMGLPQGGATALQDSSAFWGPGGLLCRLQMQHDGAVTAVRPQVLLPMLARELAGLRVEQMMAMQQAVMLEYGWMLGLSSEGMLQLSPLKWIEQPSDAVAALDLGHAVGMQALDSLFVDEDEETDDGAELDAAKLSPNVGSFSDLADEFDMPWDEAGSARAKRPTLH